VAANSCWRVNWRYADASGKILQQYSEQSADFIVVLAPTGPDGTARPLISDLLAKIASNFPTPAGASIVLGVISSSQTPTVYS
jgi:hypothetical protein